MRQAHVLELGRLRPYLIAFARQRLRNAAQAEDVVQDALLAALEGIDRFAGGSSLRTWLIGILKHKIIDLVRGCAREEPLEIEDNEAFVDERGPHGEYERQRFFESLERSLKQLPPNTARAFELREIWGADATDICTQLGVTRSNCWVLLHRARMRLRAIPEMRGLASDAV